MNKINLRGFRINSDGQEEFWSSVERGEWEPYSFDLLEKNIEPGKFFIDLGAWNGVLSIYASKLGAKIICTEPDDEARNLLRENFNLNEMKKNSSIHSYAITNFNGITTLNSSNFGDSTSNLLGKGSKKSTVKTVELRVFLNGLDAQDISLIKIDIEGAEVFVIPNSFKWLEIYRPKIYISFHPAWFPDFKINCEIFLKLFEIYNVFGVIYDNKQYSQNDFLEAMKSEHNHSFLLLPK